MKVDGVSGNGEHLDGALGVEVEDCDLPQDRQTDRLIRKVQLARIETDRERQDSVVFRTEKEHQENKQFIIID